MRTRSRAFSSSVQSLSRRRYKVDIQGSWSMSRPDRSSIHFQLQFSIYWLSDQIPSIILILKSFLRYLINLKKLVTIHFKRICDGLSTSYAEIKIKLTLSISFSANISIEFYCSFLLSFWLIEMVALTFPYFTWYCQIVWLVNLVNGNHQLVRYIVFLLV